MKILIIEDDAATAAYVANGLKQVGHSVDHAPDELLEGDLGLPAQDLAGLARIADEQIDLSGAHVALILGHVGLIVQPRVAERQLAELAYRVGLASGDHVIVRSVLLQHHPHRLHVIARKAPIPLRFEIAQMQLVEHSEFDPRDAVADLARHELQTSTRRLMVEAYSADREQIV